MVLPASCMDWWVNDFPPIHTLHIIITLTSNNLILPSATTVGRCVILSLLSPWCHQTPKPKEHSSYHDVAVFSPDVIPLIKSAGFIEHCSGWLLLSLLLILFCRRHKHQVPPCPVPVAGHTDSYIDPLGFRRRNAVTMAAKISPKLAAYAGAMRIKSPCHTTLCSAWVALLTKRTRSFRAQEAKNGHRRSSLSGATTSPSPIALTGSIALVLSPNASVKLYTPYITRPTLLFCIGIELLWIWFYLI